MLWPYVEIPVKTNDIIVFPGWLWHKTQASNTEEDRYVMTINWKFEPPTFNRQKIKRLEFTIMTPNTMESSQLNKNLNTISTPFWMVSQMMMI